ncbi:MAG: nitrile hydratase subunit alpha, partial [Nitrososphaerales archaeon]
MKTKNSHMHDYDAHAAALDADLEYYYTKRLMPLVLQLFRKRYVDLYDFASYNAPKLAVKRKSTGKRSKDFEKQLRNLEDRFDEFVKGINRIGPGWAAFNDVSILTDDVRKERGDYDEFYHIIKRERSSNLSARIQALEMDLSNYQLVLDDVTSVLRKNGLLNKQVAKRLRSKTTFPSLLNGSRIVARAWVDPSFKEKLLMNAREAVRDLEIPPGRLGQLQVVENTSDVHNVIVCT